jgi:hypothetical protein
LLGKSKKNLATPPPEYDFNEKFLIEIQEKFSRNPFRVEYYHLYGLVT